MRVKGVRLCSSVVERLTCNQEVLSSILSGGSELFCRPRRLPRRAAAGWRAGTSPRRPARSARGDARSRRIEGPVGTIDDRSKLFFLFSTSLQTAALRDFSLRTPLLARNITGQYEGRTASARPGQAIMTESRSTAAHRKTVAALAILALACQPCGAFPTRSRARASDVPTDGPTDDPPLPRRRRPERHDGVHQRADSQRGVVTGYVALLSPAKRAATPRGLPAVRPFRVRARGLGVAESLGTRSRHEENFFSTRRTKTRRMRARRANDANSLSRLLSRLAPSVRVRRDAHSESRDRSRSALARLPTTQRRLSGTPRRTCRLACGPTP